MSFKLVSQVLHYTYTGIALGFFVSGTAMWARVANMQGSEQIR